MKDAFRSYYQLGPEDIEALWREGLVILDANALLNLFRYSSSTRDDFFEVLTSRQDALWIPYQVGLEFHRNRHKVVDDQRGLFARIVKVLDDATKTAAGELEKVTQHPSLDTAELARRVQASIGEIAAAVQTKRDEYESSSDQENSDTLARITELYDGRVGPKPTREELQKLFKEGEERFQKEIPPGYKDARKDGDGRFGDLVVWKQILDKGRETKKPAIFLTDDAKEDWWYKVGSNTIGPRPELIEEYYDAAEARIHFYSPRRFLDFAMQRGSEVSEESLTEVEELSRLRLESEQRRSEVRAELVRLREMEITLEEQLRSDVSRDDWVRSRSASARLSRQQMQTALNDLAARQAELDEEERQIRASFKEGAEPSEGARAQLRVIDDRRAVMRRRSQEMRDQLEDVTRLAAEAEAALAHHDSRLKVDARLRALRAGIAEVSAAYARLVAEDDESSSASY